MENSSTKKDGDIDKEKVTDVVAHSTGTDCTDVPSNVYSSVSLDIEPYEPSSIERHTIASQSQAGLANVKAVCYLLLWYIFSAGTLFSNKYILSYLNSNPTLLGCSQICVTTLCGYIQLRICTTTSRRPSNSRKFIFSMCQLGTMRFTTVVLGLIALKYVTVSFTETVKSSAPVFTVLIAWLVLGERTHWCVVLSLLPIMSGLGLTSAFDLSFNVIGFLAALINNLADCLQNVYSKLLISASEHRVHPAELQFYTSVASVILQLPLTLFFIDLRQTRRDLNGVLTLYLLANGIFFHLQSFTAYSLMAFISPVTHSVANTFKRALLIALSIIIFGNPITLLSAVGMAMVSVGVMLYNQARHYTSIAEQVPSATPDQVPSDESRSSSPS